MQMTDQFIVTDLGEAARLQSDRSQLGDPRAADFHFFSRPARCGTLCADHEPTAHKLCRPDPLKCISALRGVSSGFIALVHRTTAPASAGAVVLCGKGRVFHGAPNDNAQA